MNEIRLQTILRIPVAADVYDELQRQAEELRKPIEYLIAERLPQLAESNSIKPLIIDDDVRRRMELLLGRNLSEPDELIRILERALTLQVGETPVELTPHLLERLRSRCFGMPFDKFVALTVRRALEEYCGLR